MKTKDLTGQKFGFLTVKKYLGMCGGRATWNCICDCGAEKAYKSNILQLGSATSCGCKRVKNIIGEKFGKLTVLSRAKNKSNRSAARWRCVCECGKEKEIYGSALIQGNSTSCGCSTRHNFEVGNKFNKLTIIKPNCSRNKYLNLISECLCECGNKILLTNHQIASGKTKSCGCLRKDKNHNRFSGLGEIYGEFWGHIKQGAKRRGILFNISIEYVWNLFLKQQRRCAISGLPLKFHSTSTTCDGNASLDRIDSSKGYIIDNVQWVHKDINYMKQDNSDADFIKYCCLVADHSRQIK